MVHLKLQTFSLSLKAMHAMDRHIVTIQQCLQDHAHRRHDHVVPYAAAQLTMVGDVEPNGLDPMLVRPGKICAID